MNMIIPITNYSKPCYVPEPDHAHHKL